MDDTAPGRVMVLAPTDTGGHPMDTTTPMDAPTPARNPRLARPVPDARRCVAHNRAGGRCKRFAIRGGTVCSMHGGKEPRTAQKARLRLAELIDPAVATLAREMANADSSADRQRAANSILDRAGVPRVGAPDQETTRLLLLERILAYNGGTK